MSGHNTICVVTALLECGLLDEEIEDARSRKRGEAEVSFTLEAPCGAVPIRAAVSPEGKATRVTFGGPPSFVGRSGAVVDVPGGVGQVVGLSLVGVACVAKRRDGPRGMDLSSDL